MGKFLNVGYVYPFQISAKGWVQSMLKRSSIYSKLRKSHGFPSKTFTSGCIPS